jgi:hypothetical protein
VLARIANPRYRDSKVVSKAIKESVSTAGTAAAKAVTDKKVENVKTGTSY